MSRFDEDALVRFLDFCEEQNVAFGAELMTMFAGSKSPAFSLADSSNEELAKMMTDWARQRRKPPQRPFFAQPDAHAGVL